MEKKQKVVVMGIVEDKKKRILVSRRLDPKILDAHKKWDLPGGANEFGESLKETLVREILGKTGLKVEVLEMIPKSVSHEGNDGDVLQHTLFFCYRCKLIGGRLGLKSKKTEVVRWISIEDARGLDWLLTTKIFIELFVGKKAGK